MILGEPETVRSTIRDTKDCFLPASFTRGETGHVASHSPKLARTFG